jgi:hypothetical protein
VVVVKLVANRLTRAFLTGSPVTEFVTVPSMLPGLAAGAWAPRVPAKSAKAGRIAATFMTFAFFETTVAV